MPRKRKPATGVGKFLPCPGSFIVHPGWTFNEVLLSEKGAYFTRCSCTEMNWINWYQEGYGWDLQQVEAPPDQGGWAGRVEPLLSPPRREELMRRKKKKRGVHA